MVEINHGSTFEPDIIQYRDKKLEQKPKYQNNLSQVDKNFLNYQLFQEKKINCEALDCDDLALHELKISVGIYGQHTFFFCRNCVEKFKRMVDRNEY